MQNTNNTLLISCDSCGKAWTIKSEILIETLWSGTQRLLPGAISHELFEHHLKTRSEEHTYHGHQLYHVATFEGRIFGTFTTTSYGICFEPLQENRRPNKEIR